MNRFPPSGFLRPYVRLTANPDTTLAGNNIFLTLTATDDTSIVTTTLTVDGNEVSLDI
jgi:hypothetical protein